MRKSNRSWKRWILALGALGALTPLVGVGPCTVAGGVGGGDPCDPLDPTRCLFPFPNDYFTVADPTSPTGRRVALDPEALPANAAGTKVDPSKWNVLDGFSVGPMIVTDIPDLDLVATEAPLETNIARSLEADTPIALIDAETGERQLLWAERDHGGVVSQERPIILRVGRNLPNGHRYIVALRNLRDAAGNPLEAGAAFTLFRDRIPTEMPAFEARRPHMEEIFATLEDAGFRRDELFLAWDFTTQSEESIAGKLLHMRDDAFDRVLAGRAPAFQVESVEEPLDDRIFRRIDGTFEVPLYMNDGGAPGSLLRLGPDGMPVNEGDFYTARFRCIIPWSATTDGSAPAVPARASLYGHGLLGSEDEVSAGNVRDMAAEHDFVFCGTRWSGMEEDDYNTALDIIFDFSDFPKFPERLHQGMLNFLVLGRLMIHPDGFASDPAFQVDGESVIDRSDLFYDSNSQGAIAGGALAAIAQDFTRAVLGVPGMNYSTLLHRSRDFDDFNTFFEASYPNGFDRTLLISLAEMLWEETEMSGHANHTTRDPYPGTPAKKILLHMAFGDHQVANVSAEVEARSLGAYIHEPALAADKVFPEVQPYFGIPPIHPFAHGLRRGRTDLLDTNPSRGARGGKRPRGRARGFDRFDGSALVVWDSGNPAAPIGNTPPKNLGPDDPEWEQLLPCPRQYQGDPHECPRRQPAARLQKSEFLRSDGAVVDVCNGGPCFAPN
jgi:hypothetical protein